MKDGKVQQCIDYIRFTMEMEGSGLEADQEDLLKSVLTEEKDADSIVADFIQAQNFDSNYQADFDEMSTYPDSKCLVNYFNIRDRKLLRRTEHFLVNVRTAQLFVHPLEMGLSFSYLVAVHSHLFGDLYPSAGMIRTSDASKRKEFCRPQYIEKYSDELFAKLSNDGYLKRIKDKEDYVNDLAFYMGEAEAIHPFRDGNGRAVRFFFSRLVHESGHTLRWADADPDRMLEASIAAIDGDYQALVDVLEEILD